MKKNNKRGLEALFSGNLHDLVSEIENYKGNDLLIKNIDINSIIPNPYQGRKFFDEKKINELKNSIAENGLISPIILTENNKKTNYILIAGERRFRACKMLGLKSIKAIVLEEIDDEKLINISLVENNQRENLNPIDEANAYKYAMDKCNYTQEDLARKLGKSRAHIANTLRMLNLSNKNKEYLSSGKLTMGHGKILASLSKDEQLKWGTQIEKNNISVHELSKMISKKNNKNQYLNYENKLTKVVASKVEINDKKITIFYHGEENLKNILISLGIKWD